MWQDEQSGRNGFVVMMMLILGIIIGWHYFYEAPRLQSMMAERRQHKSEDAKTNNDLDLDIKSGAQKALVSQIDIRENVTLSDEFVDIKTDKIIGRWRINGAVLSNVTLHDYRADVDNETLIEVLSLTNGNEQYYVSLGWISDDVKALPGRNTKWSYHISPQISCDGKKATEGAVCKDSKLHMFWSNGAQDFRIVLSIIDDYMIQSEQSVFDHSGHDVIVTPYIRIKRSGVSLDSEAVSHQGPVALINGVFKEFSYNDVKKKSNIRYQDSGNGWFGISDKYWLAAIMPDYEHSNTPYDLNMRYLANGLKHNFQAEMVFAQNKERNFYAKDGNEKHFSNNTGYISRIFVGPKDVTVLDRYAKLYNIKLFDRAIDFGVMYFITKPILLFLKFIYKFVGNYGVAIVFLTIIVRCLLWPLARKSYTSMAKMKLLQPKIAELRERHKSDKASLNRAMIDCYKSAKINPISGILPIIVQIPIFFALYKVLYISIEMRHSAFVFWIQDLASPDPTSIFNLFGLLKFDVPGFLRIGVLPIIMGFTMWLQQRMSTTVDAAHAKLLTWMPVIFTFLFANFASGLMIYWIVSNTFSIIQQSLVVRKFSETV